MTTRTLRTLAAVLLAACLSTTAEAFQQTPERITIGGPGSCGSDGFNDPGRLNDGITEAAAVYIFDLDTSTGILTVEVTNTSPVIPGVPNPVLTEIYFNTPAEVTGITMMTQVAAGGVTPAFGMSYDADRFSPPATNVSSPFGSFSVGLTNPGGISGGIANAAADTLPAPPGSLAMGPVVFTFLLSGDMTGVDERLFTEACSGTPPGDKPAMGSAKFQGGGVAGASGNISNAAVECFLLVARAEGASSFPAPTPSGHVFPTQVGGIVRYHGMSSNAPVTIPFRVADPVAGVGRTAYEWRRFYVQGLLWNPDFAQPEQWSQPIEVWVNSAGAAYAFPFGSASGLTLDVDVVTNANGELFVRFPFSANEN